MKIETLCGYVNYWSEKRGDEIALYEKNKQITYGNFRKIVRGFQNFYIENEVKIGDVVALVDIKTILGVAQYLALFGLGVSVLPINEELNNITAKNLLKSVELKGISIHRSIAEKYLGIKFNLRELNDDNEFVWMPKNQIQQIFNLNPNKKNIEKDLIWSFVKVSIDNYNLCYDSKEQRKVYYNVTSGSTGEPLIAAFTDKEIIANALSVNKVFKLKHEDCYCNLFSTDMHPHETFARPLVSGCKMGIFNTRNIRSFPDFTKKIKITQILCTPIVIETLLKLSIDVNKLSTITRYLCGGESVSYSLRKKFYNYMGKKLDPVWGSTETLGTTFYVPRSNLLSAESVLGIPLDGYSVKIDDKTNELLIKGEACFKEYLNNSSINAFNEDGYYKTKDVVCIKNQIFIFKGRNDSIVKIRGRKISLIYIEERILEIKNIVNAYVVKLDDSFQNSNIGIGLIVKSNCSIENLYKEISNVIGNGFSFRIFILEDMPRLPSGKIDRKGLIKYMNLTLKKK